MAAFRPGYNPKAGCEEAGKGPETVALGRKKLRSWPRNRLHIIVNLYYRRRATGGVQPPGASKPPANSVARPVMGRSGPAMLSPAERDKSSSALID
jgi:hypothetical protein